MDLFILHLKKQVEQNAPTLTTKIIDNDITGVTRFGKVRSTYYCTIAKTHSNEQSLGILLKID